MTENVENLFGGPKRETLDAINDDMAARFRDLADRAERGEVAAMFYVTLSPALDVNAGWLGHMGTTLTLRGAVVAGTAYFDNDEL